MFKLRNLAVALALAFVSNMSLISISAADSTRFAPSGAAVGSGQNNYVWTQLMVRFSFTSPNTYSYCASRTSPKRWGFNVFVCPSNSSINNSLTITETNAYNTVCRRQVSSTSIPNVSIRPYGNGGAQMDALQCQVPVGAWVPAYVLTKNQGTNTATEATVLGQKVYINYQGGTIPFVQPTASKAYFDVSGLWGKPTGGDNPTFIQKLMPSGFPSVNVTFPACRDTPNC
jgi:hypothetical protein